MPTTSFTKQTLATRNSLPGIPAPNRPVLGNGERAGELTTRTIQRAVRDDGICVLTFDRPNSAANIFDRRTLTELAEELDLIAADSRLKGLVLASGKRSIFIAG